MPEFIETERRIAMLIDGDNAQQSLLDAMIAEVSRYGTITVRRAYGDWTQPNLSGWRTAMLSHAIQPIQQWRYTTGKNATDSALIIDAMDILYSGIVQGFCIVSSDSDYTRLGTRIRESGLFVMGMGHKQTPESFIKACEVFVYVENLNPPVSSKAETASKKEANGNSAPAKGRADPVPLLRRAFDIASQTDDGWAHLGALGQALHRLDPSFDSRTYGHKSLSLLIKSLPKHFEVKGAKKSGASSIYVRLKDD